MAEPKELPEVFLHLGPHKTGSTFIQSKIRRNSKLFQARFEIALVGNESVKPLVTACRQLHIQRKNRAKRAKARKAILTEARALSDRWRDSPKPILLSNEFYAGVMVGLRKDWAIFPMLGEIGKALLEGLAPRKVTFIAYRRPHDKWVKSAYNQTVRTDACPFSFQDFQNRIEPDQSLDHAIASLKTTVGSERVLVFDMEEDSRREGGLGSLMFEAVGLSQSEVRGLSAAEAANPSWQPSSLELQRLVNNTKLTYQAKRIVAGVIENNQHLFAPSKTP